MDKRKPFLVEDAGDCTECHTRPARIAVPGPGGSTWLFCIGCAHRWLADNLERLADEVAALPIEGGEG